MSLFDKLKETFATPKLPTNAKPLFGGPSVNERNLTFVGVSYNKMIINNLVYDARYGETRRFSAFKREVLQDPFIFGETNKVRSKLIKSPFRIVTYPPSLTKPSVANTTDGLKASAVSEYVRQQLSDAEVLIKRAIENIWYGLLDGVAVLEIIVENVDGTVRLKALNPVAQERICYMPNTTRLAIQLTDDMSKLTPLDTVSDHFIIFQADANDPSPDRHGILRKIVYPWFIKRYVMEFWVRHAELYGQPMRVAKYPQADDELRAKLESILKNAGNASYMAVPDSVIIDFINGATNANSALHKDLVENMNEAISISILGSTQTTKIMPDAGSRASSRVHAEVATETVEGYALAICDCLRDQLVRKLVTYQFGAEDAYSYTPLLQINISGYDDIKHFSDSVQTLANSGLPIPFSYVYDATGIPVPDPQEPVLHAVTAPGAPLQPVSPADSGEPGASGPDNSATPIQPVAPSTPINKPSTGQKLATQKFSVHKDAPKSAMEAVLAPYVEHANQVKAEGGDLRRVLASINLLALSNGHNKKKAEAIVQAYLVDGFMRGYTE